MATFTAAVAAACLSWQCNYTRGDERWCLKQLHRLYQLLIDHRDELVACLSGTTMCVEAYEKELALLVGDINQHISNVAKIPTKQREKQTHLGRLHITNRSAGISLIISGLDNPVRYMLAPLAASIAAGNVTVLATVAGPDDRLIFLLSRLWSKYLDPDCNFLVPAFKASGMDIEDIDIVTIYDNSSKPYGSVLASPKTRFHDTSIASNLAVITEGEKHWVRIIEEVGFMSSEQVLPSDRLHAVFVRKEEAESLKQALSESNAARDLKAMIVKPNTAILDTMLEDYPSTDLEIRLQSAKEKASLLVLSVKSLERAIDAMISLHTPIQQLAVLGPEADKIASFAQNWLSLRTISVGCIYPVALPELEGQNQEPYSSQLISPATFSRSMIEARQKPTHWSHNIKEIRASYKDLIPPLKPEPRGERIGFFTQVDYLVKGVGATLGVVTIAGLIYGVRHL